MKTRVKKTQKQKSSKSNKKVVKIKVIHPLGVQLYKNNNSKRVVIFECGDQVYALKSDFFQMEKINRSDAAYLMHAIEAEGFNYIRKI